MKYSFLVIIAVFAFQTFAQSVPRYHLVAPGTAGDGLLRVYVSKGQSNNNPNGYPVVVIDANGLFLGFLLDGSEYASLMFSNAQEAARNAKGLEIGYDDNSSNGYGAETVPTSGLWCRRVYSVALMR